MDSVPRIEHALNAALYRAGANGAPPGLIAAMRDAVFPGGARIRPRLCLAVAAACDEDAPAITDAAATAIELLHCASLVHDDLPCFDNAATRRGKPAVHRVFGEPLAVLAGDALIVLAFEVLAEASTPGRLVPLVQTISRAVGTPNGIVAGQAWESETDVVLADYHRAKTGSLFAAATMAGAIAAGANAEVWWALGDLIGHAYQVADDLRDALGNPIELGKPTGVDEPLGRPSAVIRLGVDGAVRRLEQLVEAAVAAVPDCPGAGGLRRLLRKQVAHFIPTQAALDGYMAE